MTEKKTGKAAQKSKADREDLKKKYEHLLNDYKNIWKASSDEDRKQIFDFANEYKKFIDSAKTEREFVSEAITSATEKGFVDIKSVKALKTGQKVFASIKGKGLVLAVIGKKPMSDGFNILGAHVDSPRLDLKPNPVYEEEETVYLKTHYYGGIKKYQWTTIPLSIHGIVYLKDGSEVSICIGENEEDPVFYITDLLPHLGNEQMNRKGTDIVKGEDLNVIIGGIPIEDDVPQAFKIGILKYLFENYGMTERDFVSAELEIVPSMKAKDVGFDRSFVAAYGHDDRVCAYPALATILEISKPEKTCVCMLTDKEEIGSYGNTGAQSRLYENVLAELLNKQNGAYDELLFRKAIENSKMLSADVSNGFDPKYSSVSDPRNSAYMSHGIKIEKYVGARGKSGTNDANGAFVAEVIKAFEDHGVIWQTGELGKIDEGGGGTISAYMAQFGLEVLDCGVPVMSMHAPYELISKADLYHTYLAYKAFVLHMK